MKKKPDTHLLLCISAAVLIFFLCAHGFGFTNLIFSGSSLSLAVSEDASAEIGAGNWFQPFYFRIRGGISAPMLVGLLSFLYTAIVCYCVCSLLSIQNLRLIVLTCGVFVLSPGLLACFCGGMNTADASLCALALGAIGAVCLFAAPLGWLLTCILFGLSASLSIQAACFGPMLLAMSLLQRQAPLPDTLKSISACLAEAILYTAGLLLFLHRYNVACTFVPFSSFRAATLLSPLLSFVQPFTAYPILAPLCTGLLLLIFAAALLKSPFDVACLLRSFFSVLVLLLFSAIPSMITGKNLQVRLTDWLFALIILQPLLTAERPFLRLSLQKAVSLLCGILFLGQVIFANQIYLKKNLEFQSTLSVMTRVLSRLEQTDGYVPGKTQVAFYGTIENSALSVSHKGFERLDCFDAAENHFGITDEDQNTTYFWQIMGYPVNALSDYQREQLRESADLPSLEIFPTENCIRYCGDVLVMKLSD